MSDNSLLLIPDPIRAQPLTQLGIQLSYQVHGVATIRKAIQHLRKQPVDVIVTEFFPMVFHDRVSELESLFATRDNQFSHVRICVLVEKHLRSSVEQLSCRYRLDQVCYLPLKLFEVQTCLHAWYTP